MLVEVTVHSFLQGLEGDFWRLSQKKKKRNLPKKNVKEEMPDHVCLGKISYVHGKSSASQMEKNLSS